jgi:hypothetical protein
MRDPSSSCGHHCRVHRDLLNGDSQSLQQIHIYEFYLTLAAELARFRPAVGHQLIALPVMSPKVEAAKARMRQLIVSLEGFNFNHPPSQTEIYRAGKASR